MTTLTSTSPPPAARGAWIDARSAAPIIAAVDDSAASRAAVDDAIGLAADLDAPLVFVHVRRGPAAMFGGPVYKRRLAKELERARRVVERAVRVADLAEVGAEAEILEGSPGRRIVEYARDRGAQLVVVGSQRRRLRRGVAHEVARTADRPVFVAARRRSDPALARAA
ncbi:MAG TPA: universal stress protein [Gaiellaceae bacterium]|jgi:nucleotide-binding universal stress UspA family protein|nr:universal stress protein [Gaiellaceae bacterium]